MFENIKVHMTNHTVFIGSDAHYWPDQKPSTAHRAFCYLLKESPADYVVINGDAFDADGISTHPPKQKKVPSLLRQLNETKKRMAEIKAAFLFGNGSANDNRFLYVFGNHEARFGKFLAKHAAKFTGLKGFTLAEHFPEWYCTEKVELGGKEKCVVIHELSGGQNPLKQNLLKAGCHIVTGHHHSQNILAFTDYAGTRYAVDAGMLGRIGSSQFGYGGGAPVNWRSGFVILRWLNGRLLPPQTVTVIDEKKGLICYGGTVLYV